MFQSWKYALARMVEYMLAKKNTIANVMVGGLANGSECYQRVLEVSRALFFCNLFWNLPDSLKTYKYQFKKHYS